MDGEDFGFTPDPTPGYGDNAATAVAEPPLYNTEDDLARIRQGYAQELNNPRVAGQLYALTHREVGSQGRDAQQAFMETVFNRAASRGMSLAQVMADPNYYPRQSLGRAAFTQDQVHNYRQVALDTIQGSNISNYATGNASGTVGFAGGPQTYRAGGERFGIEGPDKNWMGRAVPTARPADVQEVRIERGVPVTPVEMEVRRAKPVGGDFGFVPEQPAAPEAPDFGFVADQQAAPPAAHPFLDMVHKGLEFARKPSPEWMRPIEKALTSELPYAKEVAEAAIASNPLTAPYYWLGQAAPETVPGKLSKGFTEGLRDVGAGFSSPANLALLATGVGETALAGRLVAGGFFALAASQFPEQWKAFNETDDLAEKTKILTSMAAGLGLPLAGFAAAGKGGTRIERRSQQWRDKVIYPEEPPQLGPAAAPQLPGGGWQKKGNMWVNVDAAGNVNTHPAEFDFVPELPAPQRGLPAPEEVPTGDFEAVTPGRGPQLQVTTQPEAALPQDFVETGAPAEVTPGAPRALPAPAAPLPPEAAQWQGLTPAQRFNALARGDPRRARLDPAPLQALAAANWQDLSPNDQSKMAIEIRSAPQTWQPTAPQAAPAAAPVPAGSTPAPRIAAAAVKVGDKIYRGSTHAEAFEKSGLPKDEYGTIPDENAKGFVTTDGKYVNPEEAAQIARAAKQLKNPEHPFIGVTAEDVNLAETGNKPAPKETAEAAAPQVGDTVTSKKTGKSYEVSYVDPAGKIYGRAEGKGGAVGLGTADKVEIQGTGARPASDPIVDTAVRTPDGKVHTGLDFLKAQGDEGAHEPGRVGALHNEIHYGVLEGNYEPRDINASIDGYVTKSGRFLDKKEALQHATEQKQISKTQYQEIRANQLGKKPEQIKTLDSIAFEDAQERAQTGAGSKPVPVRGRPARPLTKAQQAEAEHRAEMLRQGQEAIAQQGGMELLDALKLEGGLPLKGTERAHPYRGELQMLREHVMGTKGYRYRDIFSSRARGVDDLVMKLQARGFDIQTPHELIQRVMDRIVSGRPHYGLIEHGETLYGDQGLLSIDASTGNPYVLTDATRKAFTPTGKARPELAALRASLLRRRGIDVSPQEVRFDPSKAGGLSRLHPDKGPEAVAKAEAIVRANGGEPIWFRLDQPLGDLAGTHLKGTNKVLLNVDASNGDLVTQTAGHELNHFLQRRFPKLHAELRDNIDAIHAKSPELELWTASRAQHYPAEELADEFVSDLMGETLRNPARVAQLLGDRPTLFQRLLGAVRDFIDRVMSKLRPQKNPTASAVMSDLGKAREQIMNFLAQAREAATGPPGAPGEMQFSMKGPLSGIERAELDALRRTEQTGPLTALEKHKLLRLEGRERTQAELPQAGEVFNLTGEQAIDWAARAREAEAADAVRAQSQAAAEKAQLDMFSEPDMSYSIKTANVKEGNGAGKPPNGPRGASMFAPNTPPRSNPQPIWARRYWNKFEKWWQDKLPRSWEVVRKVPESPVISEHQRLLDAERDYMENFTSQKWWQTLRRRPEEEIIELEHQAVMDYRRMLAGNVPREVAWARAVSQMPPDVQALFQWREARVPVERAAARGLAVDEPAYTGDPYLARLTNEEGKAVVDLSPQIANWGRHIRQSIGGFDKSRVHPTMKMGINAGTQYETPTMAAFVRELYSMRLEGTARMLRALKEKGVLFDEKADALAANKALKKNAGDVTLVRGFGGKDYWARSRVEAQFLGQNLNAVSAGGSMGKLVRVANAFARNPNLMFNPLPHATKNMAFKYALARVGNYGFKKAAREYSTNAQMRARFEAVMSLPKSGRTLPQLRALEAGSYAERIAAKWGKWLSANHLSARFNFAIADPAMRYALWKTYVKKGLSDQAAANHVWVDLIRYDENSGALNFWKGIPFNFFSTWRLGSYISIFKQLRNHPIRSLLFIGAVEYLREILYRKFGWWTHLPVDYVDAPLAEAIEKPSAIPGIAAMTYMFGPGGAQAPHTISDVMAAVHGDVGMKSRVVNMFWGLSQLFNIPMEFNAYLKDQNPEHLALILQNAAFSTHSALKYQPHRLMQWLPESLPGMEKSAKVRYAEFLQAKIEARQEKARETYEARHGIGPSLQYRTEEGQMQALQRAAGVKPGGAPPKPPGKAHIQRPRIKH